MNSPFIHYWTTIESPSLIWIHRLQAWPPDQDDVDGRLKRLFEGCAEQLLPGGEGGHGDNAKPREAEAAEEVINPLAMVFHELCVICHEWYYTLWL